MLEILRHPHHDPVFYVEQDLLLFPPVPDERVERVAVRNPADQARVGGQRDHREPLDRQVTSATKSGDQDGKDDR